MTKTRQPVPEKQKSPPANEWQAVRFGDVARKISDTTDRKNCDLDRFVAGEHMQTDDFRIKEWGTIDEGYLGPAFNHKFRKGQILYGSRRTYLRKVSIPHFDGLCANTTFVIEPQGDALVPELLPFVMQSEAFTAHSIRMSKGSTNPYINWKDIACFEFAIPEKDEQRRIATTLWAAEDCIVKGERFFEKCKQIKQLFLKELFLRGIGHNKFQSTNIGEIPREWELVKFDKAVTIETGQIDPRLDRYKKLLHIGSENIESGTGVLSPLETNEKLGISSGNYCFTPSHILYSKIRPYFKKAAYPKIHGTCAADIYPLLCNTENFVDTFVFQYLLSEHFNVQAISYQNRTGMPKINRDEMNSIFIPKPPLPEQRQIAGILTRCDETIAAARANVAAAKALKMRLINEMLGVGI